MTNIRYTWSQGTHDPVEHFAANNMYAQPICGAVLNVGWQTFADKPSGFARLCPTCQARAKTFPVVRPGGLYRNALTGIEIKSETKGLAAGRFVTEWIVTEPVVDGERSWITTSSTFTDAREAALEAVERVLAAA